MPMPKSEKVNRLIVGGWDLNGGLDSPATLLIDDGGKAGETNESLGEHQNRQN